MIYEFTEIEKMNYVNGSKYFSKKMEKQFITSTFVKFYFFSIENIVTSWLNVIIF